MPKPIVTQEVNHDLTPNVRPIAALYIDPRGPYPGRLGVSVYGLPDRDAKAYDGPWPIVAHPPCGPWGQLRHLCRLQDPTCGPRAVEQVRRWGGVLEHPAHSKLWDRCGLPKPNRMYEFDREPGVPNHPPRFAFGDSDVDAWGGRTYYVEQVDWGHCARKATWLYVVGLVSQLRIENLLVSRAGTGTPTHWISGHTQAKRRGAGTTMLRTSSEKARRTPPAFADLLIEIARRCRAPDPLETLEKRLDACARRTKELEQSP